MRTDVDEIAVERIMRGTLEVPHHAQIPELIEAIRVLSGRGLTDREVGERIGRSRVAVARVRRYHRIAPGVPAPWQLSITPDAQELNA